MFVFKYMKFYYSKYQIKLKFGSQIYIWLKLKNYFILLNSPTSLYFLNKLNKAYTIGYATNLLLTDFNQLIKLKSVPILENSRSNNLSQH